MHDACLASSFADLREGKRSEINVAMILITNNSSISVNDRKKGCDTMPRLSEDQPELVAEERLILKPLNVLPIPSVAPVPILRVLDSASIVELAHPIFPKLHLKNANIN